MCACIYYDHKNNASYSAMPVSGRQILTKLKLMQALKL